MAHCKKFRLNGKDVVSSKMLSKLITLLEIVILENRQNINSIKLFVLLIEEIIKLILV